MVYRARFDPYLLFMASATNNGASPPPPTPPPTLLAAAGSSTPMAFLHTVTAKLTDSNYLLCRSQVQPVIKGLGILSYILALQIPQKFASIHDRDHNIVTPEYQF